MTKGETKHNDGTYRERERKAWQWSQLEYNTISDRRGSTYVQEDRQTVAPFTNFYCHGGHILWLCGRKPYSTRRLNSGLLFELEPRFANSFQWKRNKGVTLESQVNARKVYQLLILWWKVVTKRKAVPGKDSHF